MLLCSILLVFLRRKRLMRLGAFDIVATIIRILGWRLLLSCHGPALSVMNKVLSDPEEQLLWKNFHDQRGDDSLWLRNFNEAAATFCGELVKRGNLHTPNCKQLSSWFERAALRHAVPPCRKEDIFRFGADGCNIRKEAAELTTTPANDPIDSHLLHLTDPIRPARSGKAHRSSAKDRNRQRKPSITRSRGKARCQMPHAFHARPPRRTVSFTLNMRSADTAPSKGFQHKSVKLVAPEVGILRGLALTTDAQSPKIGGTTLSPEHSILY